MAPRASERTESSKVHVSESRAAYWLLAFGVLAATVISPVEWGAVLVRVLSDLHSTAAIGMSSLVVALTALGFIAIGGPGRCPVAIMFAATVALGALSFLSQVSWLGERF